MVNAAGLFQKAGSFDPTKLIAGAVSLVAVVPLIKAATIIRQGEIGIRTRFGKPYQKKGQWKIVRPGLCFMFPGTHSIVKINVQHQTDTLQDIVVERDRVQRQIKASITWRVLQSPEDIYRAVYRADDLQKRIVEAASAALVQAVQDGVTDLTQPLQVRASLNWYCREALREYGVQLERVNITTNAPTDASVLADAIRESQYRAELTAVLAAKEGGLEAEGIGAL